MIVKIHLIIQYQQYLTQKMLLKLLNILAKVYKRSVSQVLLLMIVRLVLAMEN